MKRVFRLIRSVTPIPLRRLIHRAGTYFGWGLASVEDFPSVPGTLRTLHRLGLNPRFCIDVGAYQGEWTKVFRNEFPKTEVLMVEAQEAKRSILQNVVAADPENINMEIALLGALDDQSVAFAEMGTGSSVFEEASSYSRTVTKRATVRLDTLMERGRYPKADFLKLDVQGYELEILKGAPKVLQTVSAILLEASLVSINAGCPLIAEIFSFMDSAGFRLFDFCDQNRRTDGVLWQVDLMFLRADAEILPEARLTSSNWSVPTF